jgi:hypothetical protein
MEHEDAIQMNAVEGYLLDDLTDDERDAFEEHCADCKTCFADVQAGATFTTTLGELTDLRELTDLVPVPVPASRYNPRFVFATAASLVLSIGCVGYQHFAVIAPLRAQLAELNQPHKIPVHTLIVQRGPEKKNLVDGSRDSILEFDVDPELAPAPFTCKIVDANGKTRGRPFSVTANETSDLIALQIPAKFLEPGTYSLIVTGTGGVSEPDIKKFEVR